MRIISLIDLHTVNLMCLGINSIISVVLYFIYKNLGKYIDGVLYFLSGFLMLSAAGACVLLGEIVQEDLIGILSSFLIISGSALFAKGFTKVLKIQFQEWHNIPLAFGPVAGLMLLILNIDHEGHIFLSSLFLVMIFFFNSLSLRRYTKKKVVNLLLTLNSTLIVLLSGRIGYYLYHKIEYDNANSLPYDHLIVLLIVMAGYGVITCMFYSLGTEMSRKANFLSEKNQILAKEMNHRVNNNLNRVIGMVNIMEEEYKDDDLSNAFKIIQSRIFSISQIHQQLYKTNSMQDIRIDIYLPQLVSQVVDSFGLPQIKLDVKSDEITIDSDRGLLLGMLINELAINSCKYAFNTNEAGHIWLKIHLVKDEILIGYKDSGNGLSKTASKGFGSQIIRQTLSTLDASIQYIKNGNFEVEITFTTERKKEAFIQNQLLASLI